jgi:NAD-dependent dihydropyrimidine dehydrogenase PreA subunit
MAGIAVISEACIDVKDRACVHACPVGAIYSEDHLPDGSPTSAKYNDDEPNLGHDHTYFLQHSREVFAD